jgi:very-short-patch-repair endonuclease
MQRKHNKRLTPVAKNLRKAMTKEERHLWHDFLRDYPVRFLRQKVIGDYIVDFYCRQAQLVIELDGSQHFTEEGLVKDAIRTECIADYELMVMRIDNLSVMRNFTGVCEQIDRIVRERTSPPVSPAD